MPLVGSDVSIISIQHISFTSLLNLSGSVSDIYISITGSCSCLLKCFATELVDDFSLNVSLVLSDTGP